jgi:hypothetical protein
MNNPNFLAQMAHFLGGALLITLSGLFFGVYGMWAALITGILLAAIKEFWYDMVYELPKQTWGDSILDFTFYVVGGLAGIGIIYLAIALKKI